MITTRGALLLPLFCLFAWSRSLVAEKSCEASTLLNSAFVFVKPHANTVSTRKLIKEKLESSGLLILSEYDIDAEEIEKNQLIDLHYYAIASKATLLSPAVIDVPIDRFLSEFGESWETVLRDKRVFNAMEACEQFNCAPDELNEAWIQAKKVVRLGGGFYCGLVSVREQQPFYVFNAFFMSMRGKYVAPGSSIHCYVVEWDPNQMSWKVFRNKFLGPTDPAEAPEGSLRRLIFDNYKKLGLESMPTKGDNGVHASASPLEGLVERVNWLGVNIQDDPYGKSLLHGGIAKDSIRAWSKDPRVNLPDGSRGSVFDAVEDLNAEECKTKLIEINRLNK